MKLSKRLGYLNSLGQFTSSIRFRLVLWFVVILGLVMILFSAFVYWRQAQDMRSNAIARLYAMEERFLGPQQEREGEIEQLPPGLFQSSVPDTLQEDVVAILAPDGSVLQASGALDAQQIKKFSLPGIGWEGVQEASLPTGDKLNGGRYLFTSSPILKDGQISASLLLGVPLDPNGQMRRLLLSLVVGNLLTLAIALMGGFWLADQAMRPVHTISHTVQQIGETDLHKRLHLRGKDELAELGNTFDAMLDRLQAAFERQRQFTADASHELRTPLTIIDLEARRGLSTRRTLDEQDKILHTIQSENQLMIRMVNNLLDLARMDAGQIVLKTELMDLGDLTLEVFERLSPLARSQGVDLSIDELPDLLILGDKTTLMQLVTNLVENAIKYSAKVPHPQVHISAGKVDENGKHLTWVRVKDNGAGIPTEQQAHIFDRFYQVEASRSRGNRANGNTPTIESSGTGLGLAIAQWIAHAHHGEIRVESADGQGSTFELVLPAYNHGN